jgi:hypothetical protein
MTWVPVLYICLTMGVCAFIQGTPTYSENGCKEQLAQAAQAMQQDPQVLAFDGTCILVTPT